MKLAYKITLLLFVVIALFIGITSFYFYSQISDNFTRRSEERMNQTAQSIDTRINALRETLQRELQRLSSSVFSENETALAGILSRPPDFNSEVIGFAEKLRKQTTLDFLYVISPDGIILSDSLQPARYGKLDLARDFPLNQTAFLFEQSSCLELKRSAVFGKREIHLRGGFFLKDKLESLASPEVHLEIQEIDPESEFLPVSATETNGELLKRTIVWKDYQDRPILQITATVSSKQLIQEKRALVRNSILWIAGSFLVCLLTGLALSFSITRPIARLTNAATEMASGNLEVRIHDPSGGEVGKLIHAFNEMAGRLQENQERLIQSERIAAWQEIARHLAHEIKNPLMPIRTSLANLRVCLEKAPEKFAEIFPESSQSILEEVETLRHLADEFSRFARLPAPNLKKGSLNSVIQKCIALYAAAPSPSIQFEPGNLPEISFDAEQISEVIHNLLQNAVDAVGSNGMIRVSTKTVQELQYSFVQLIVQDNGKGMNEDTRRQIFKPYFTTKQKGTGLGLAIVHRIITEHGGSIYVQSGPDQGTRFEVLLPVS